jgi:general secretion pathway protein G
MQLLIHLENDSFLLWGFVSPMQKTPGMRRRGQTTMKWRHKGGFTLAELLVVMVILALLASLVGQELFGRLQSAEMKTAQVQLSMIKTGLQSFRIDVGRYPTEQEGLEALWAEPEGVEDWSGPYLEKEVKGDPWDHDYVYKVPGPEEYPYELKSLGADGQEGGEGVNEDISVWD